MSNESTQFKKGYDPRRGKSPGRPPKPDWIKGKGEEALKKAYEIMNRDGMHPTLVLQAAKMIAEYDLGKPKQSVDVTADIEADAKVSMIDGMSLSKRKKALDAALKIYEQDSNNK